MSFRVAIVLVAANLFVFAANADQKGKWMPDYVPKQDYTRLKSYKDKRTIASLQEIAARSESRYATRGYRGNRPMSLALGLVAGLVTRSSSSSGMGSAANQGLGSSLGLGAQADFRGWNYFGAELDGYFGLSSKSTDSNGNELKTSNSGALLSVKGQYPIQAGTTRVVPKLGLGYGLNSIGTTLAGAEGSMSSNGLFIAAGVDFEPTREWVLSADFAKSLSASGKSKSGGTERDVQGAGFDRVRLSGSYRLGHNLLGGLQFTRRAFGFTQPATALTPQAQGTTGVNQIQALFQVEL